jgi:hypothetical protein
VPTFSPTQFPTAAPSVNDLVQAAVTGVSSSMVSLAVVGAVAVTVLVMIGVVLWRRNARSKVSHRHRVDANRRSLELPWRGPEGVAAPGTSGDRDARRGSLGLELSRAPSLAFGGITNDDVKGGSVFASLPSDVLFGSQESAMVADGHTSTADTREGWRQVLSSYKIDLGPAESWLIGPTTGELVQPAMSPAAAGAPAQAAAAAAAAQAPMPSPRNGAADGEAGQQ